MRGRKKYLLGLLLSSVLGIAVMPVQGYISKGPFIFKGDDPSAKIIRAQYVFSFQCTFEGLYLAPGLGSSYR